MLFKKNANANANANSTNTKSRKASTLMRNAQWAATATVTSS
jgi:hypothetical protein